MPTFLKKKKTIPDLEEPIDKIIDNYTMTFEGNLEVSDESDIASDDPAEEDTSSSQKRNSIVYPDEPRPSEQFFQRGIVNFDESSSEDTGYEMLREEEHVGLPLSNQPKYIKKDNSLFYKKLKNLLIKKIKQENNSKK